MIAGIPPFYSEKDNEVVDLIIGGKVEFKGNIDCNHRGYLEIYTKRMYKSFKRNAHI